MNNSQRTLNDDIKKHIVKIWNLLRKKFLKSITIFISINVSIFVINALIIVFSLFALRFNHHETKPLFLAISVMSNVTSGLTTFISFFQFRKNYALCAKKIEAIKNERSLYDGRFYEYNRIDRDILYLQKVREIFYEENL